MRGSPRGAEDDSLENLIQAVQSAEKYCPISPELVRRIAVQELGKGRAFKETIKAVRNKLHQVGGAYQEKPIPYARLLEELNGQPGDIHHPQVMDFCKRIMSLHASTRERGQIVERVFQETLAGLAPIRSVLDLACGFNPLAAPWMPLAEGAAYYAHDIYADMIGLVDDFIHHFGMSGGGFISDLLAGAPEQPVELALLLKTIPCLEQVDKTAGMRLLESVQAEVVLVSFPAASLGGKSKGMAQNYAAHFAELTAGKPWQVQRFDFPGELFFLVKK